MAKKGKEKEYSTLMIVTKNSPNTRSFSIQTKHIKRLKYYLLSIFIVIAVLSYNLYVYIGKYEQNLLAEIELKLFKKEISGPLATDTLVANNYIRRIENKLKRIKKYLNQRGVKSNQVDVGGEENTNIAAINTYKYYNFYLADLIKNLKYMPVGYPHLNKNNSKYGYRSNPFHGGGSEFHSGIDIRGNIGDPVKSTAEGEVILATWSSGYGKCVRIKHAHGYETLYGHLSEIKVKQGQKIKASQEIGKLGSTGRSTGPHLHYEVRYSGHPINPEDFLEL